jgi:hypothetical protein
MPSRPWGWLMMTVVPHLGKFVRFPPGGTATHNIHLHFNPVSLFFILLLVLWVCFMLEELVYVTRPAKTLQRWWYKTESCDLVHNGLKGAPS